jgi:hypothetical protein
MEAADESLKKLQSAEASRYAPGRGGGWLAADFMLRLLVRLHGMDW